MMEKEQEIHRRKGKEKQEGTQMSEELQSLVQIIEFIRKRAGRLARLSAFSESEQQKGADRTGEKALQHRMKPHYASEGTQYHEIVWIRE